MLTVSLRKTVPLLTLAVLLAACSKDPAPAAKDAAPVGYSVQETVASTGADLVIPYQKFKLDNGLTVIVHEDHSDPLVHVDVTYHVGSAREEAMRSGFAHFFEHMMFEGSEHVGDKEHFKTVTESGGTLNGSTTEDRTNYFETVPSNMLERMLWLESDRMGFLLKAVTNEKFENQRATVKNERGQNVENRPYGRYTEVNNSAMYPNSHPYSWPVIGYPVDLDAATVDDLKRFFLRWYGPNNATLTIGGDVKAADVMGTVVKYFGEIPRGPDVKAASFPAPVLDADRYVSYLDENIRFPALLFSWPTVPAEHPDMVALDALNSILSEGRKSFFYKQFVLTRKAIQASGFHNNRELGGEFTLFVLPFPGVSLSQFETEMRNVLTNFGPDSITDEDVQIFKATREASLVRSLTSVSGKVTKLAYGQTFFNNPNLTVKELQETRKLTKDDIVRVFNQYIKGKPAVIQSIVPSNAPKGQTKPDSYAIPARLTLTATPEAAPELREPTSGFDRSIKPSPAASPLVTMPTIWEDKLGNGAKIIGTKSTEVPLVTVRLVFQGGQLAETPAQSGLGSLAAEMMSEGTDKYSAEQFENELQKLGSSIAVSSGNEATIVNVQALSDKVDATLALLEQRLLHAKYSQEDLDRLRKQNIESIQAALKEPSAIAENVWQTLLYGKDHSFGTQASTVIKNLEKFKLADVSGFAPSHLAADNLEVIVVGDIDKDAIIAKLGFLQQLPAKAMSVMRTQPAAPKYTGNTLYLIDKPGAAQSEIRIGYMTNLVYDPTGLYYERYLMNYVLGGAFNSRINLNLREDKGYTYGARSGFTGSLLPGPFTASASVRADSTADSVVQFVNEIKGYHDKGITADELTFTKNSIGQSEALKYETPAQKAGLLQQIATFNLKSDFVKQQQTMISALTQPGVNELATTHLPFENMQLLVVGDKKVINDSVKKLGYKIVELNAEGNPL